MRANRSGGVSTEKLRLSAPATGAALLVALGVAVIRLAVHDELVAGPFWSEPLVPVLADEAEVLVHLLRVRLHLLVAVERLRELLQRELRGSR
jgi:hypothetical protein